MANELTVGQQRIGSLVDFDDQTPNVDVTLRRESGDSLLVDISWRDESSPYSRWFLHNRTTIPPERPRLVPPVLLFRDSHGAVQLIGSASAGYHSNFSQGSGRLRPRYAVFGYAGHQYETVDRVRWNVTELRRWMNYTSIARVDGPDRRDDFLIDYRPGEALVVPGRDDFKLVPQTWWRQTQTDVDELHDRLLVETNVAGGSWFEHSKVPSQLRDLLVISQWRAESFRAASAARDEDRVVMPDGRDLGVSWREVLDATWRPDAEAPTTFRRDMVEFADLGLEGLARWLEVAGAYSRALDPVISSHGMRDVSPAARLAQVGPGVEALAFYLTTEGGMSRRDAARMVLAERYQLVGEVIRGIVPFDVDAWVAEGPEIYNAVKHANRSMPEEVEILNAWARCVMAVRTWVALKLGVDRLLVKERLINGSQPWDFVAVDRP